MVKEITNEDMQKISNDDKLLENKSGDPPVTTKRRIEFDYLRTFATIGVVFFHAIIAYTENAYNNPVNPIATHSPIADSNIWSGFDWFVDFGEYIGMPIMFLISGLFVWKSLERKGAGKYSLGRLLRLGIAFLIGFLLFAPLAFYPAQLQVESLYIVVPLSFGEFWRVMASTGFMQAGPFWFIWMLLAFNLLAVCIYLIYIDDKKNRAKIEESNETRIVDKEKEERNEKLKKNWNKLVDTIFTRPIILFLVVILFLIVGYYGVAFSTDSSKWIGLGPFRFQVRTIGVYIWSFLIGVAIGVYGLERGIFKPDGKMAKYWWAWILVGLITYGLTIPIELLSTNITVNRVLPIILFPIICASLMFGFIAIFLRFFTKSNKFFDSLKNNAYGIFIFHYFIVSWLQYAFLFVPSMHGILKAIIVFLGSLLLSWGLTALIRFIPGVKKVI